MCEYCGCQALTAIDELTREHDLVVNLIGGVRAAHTVTDVARMADLARQITAVLGPQTEVEEHGLFPALAPDFPDQVAALEAGHRRIEAILGEAATGTPTDPTRPGPYAYGKPWTCCASTSSKNRMGCSALANLRTAEREAVDAVRDRVGTLLPVAGHRS